MHELGILISVVKTVTELCRQQGIERVDTLVLEIGERSPVIPRYIEACYPAAVYKSFLEDTKLKIELLPGEEFNIKEILVPEA
jgi:hydrogenase nickel incorporation protein HypA/HybF